MILEKRDLLEVLYLIKHNPNFHESNSVYNKLKESECEPSLLRENINNSTNIYNNHKKYLEKFDGQILKTYEEYTKNIENLKK